MAVQIHIEDNWYIISDKYCYQLTLFSGYDKHGREKWLASKFAGTIRTILEVWAEQMIRDSDAQTFGELKAKVDELHKKIDQIGREITVESSHRS